MEPYISVLHFRLKSILKFSRRKRLKGDLEDGEDFDEDGGLERAVIGEKGIYQDDTLPGKLRYKISLLIDISGSMVGKELDYAIQAAVLVVEALKLFPPTEVDVEVYAFTSNAKIKLKI